MSICLILNFYSLDGVGTGSKPFFEALVRIQKYLGQRVIESGP
ncbi:hypothetical protein [Methanobacterium ferruginis]|nr:hypothetical protein [Methanobacterium ferruginis]